MLRAILFSVCMIVFGAVCGIAVGSIIREQIIFRECNLNGEYTGWDEEVYITCNMED